MTEYPLLGERVDWRTLACGLTVAVVPRPGFTKKLAYFVTDYGSVDTDWILEGTHHRSAAGVAHYLEHKLFDLPDRDVSAQFGALGASVNAFTSFDMTAYYFSCSEHFEPCLRLLLEFVSTPYFTPESVKKELGIIRQEIAMTADNPDSRVFENLMTGMYRSHPVRVPILGTAESIGEITPEMLTRCHRAFYAPGNMLLCVVGDVDPDEVAALADAVLGTEPRTPGKASRNWIEDMTCPQSLVEARMEVSMPMFQLGFKAEPLGRGREAVRQELIGDLAAEALFGESSELYLQLYEEGVIDSSFGGGLETVTGMALLTVSGDSREPERIRQALLDQAARLVRSGIPEEEFLRMKRSAMGRRIRDLDSFDTTCFRLCAYFFTDFDYFTFPDLYQQIQEADLLAFLERVVTPERCCLSVIYPIQEEAV